MAKIEFYDGKRLFEAYHGWGKAASLRKLAEWAKSNGMMNPETGDASPIGARQAMWKWGCKNPEESYEIWKKYHFERYPFKTVPPIEDYVKNVLLRASHHNPGILSNGDTEKLLMRFGLPYEVTKKVQENDVIQIVRQDAGAFGRGLLYGKLMIVHEVVPEEGFVIAHILNDDDTRSTHQLKYKDFGIIGRAIV